METRTTLLRKVKKHIQLMATTSSNRSYGRRTIPKIYQKVKCTTPLIPIIVFMKSENMVYTNNPPEVEHHKWYYNLNHPLIVKWCAEVGVDVTEC